ncbi:MAG: hypothetical protein ACRD4X_02250 [Candidatus Acidiferrales bacterium]
MRLAVMSVWPQMPQGAGKKTAASESMALLKTTEFDRRIGQTLPQITNYGKIVETARE